MTASVDSAPKPQLLRPMRRRDVLHVARTWIGTPYVHQGRLRTVGVDCLGVITGVFEELYGFIPRGHKVNYSATWAYRDPAFKDSEPLLEAARRWLCFSAAGARKPRPADVVLFRVRRHGPVKHCGIIEEDDRIIHAYDGHAVMVSAIPDQWRKTGMFVFTWPGVTD